MTDAEAYQKYALHRSWFNKLWFSEKMNYRCGPAGVAPDLSAYYIVRPIMNLSGMSVGARKQFIRKQDVTKVEPGYFWCEWFSGDQYSVTFERVNESWVQKSCWKGFKQSNELYKFSKWVKQDNKKFTLPEIFDDLADTNLINVEFIENAPIEVHLRESPDPDCEEFIPIWSKQDVDKYEKLGYSYIESYEDADGFLKTPRLGFMIKGDKNERKSKTVFT